MGEFLKYGFVAVNEAEFHFCHSERSPNGEVEESLFQKRDSLLPLRDQINKWQLCIKLLRGSDTVVSPL